MTPHRQAQLGDPVGGNRSRVVSGNDVDESFLERLRGEGKNANTVGLGDQEDMEQHWLSRVTKKNS
jgi:hypothetical protein